MRTPALVSRSPPHAWFGAIAPLLPRERRENPFVQAAWRLRVDRCANLAAGHPDGRPFIRSSPGALWSPAWFSQNSHRIPARTARASSHVVGTPKFGPERLLTVSAKPLLFTLKTS